jgi:hypothetical protein
MITGRDYTIHVTPGSTRGTHKDRQSINKFRQRGRISIAGTFKSDIDLMHGHFEKGAWIPGLFEALTGTCDAIVSTAKDYNDFIDAVRYFQNQEVAGRFVNGAWHSLKIKDCIDIVVKDPCGNEIEVPE